jgi:hypothetical protein
MYNRNLSSIEGSAEDMKLIKPKKGLFGAAQVQRCWGLQKTKNR